MLSVSRRCCAAWSRKGGQVLAACWLPELRCQHRAAIVEGEHLHCTMNCTILLFFRRSLGGPSQQARQQPRLELAGGTAPPHSWRASHPWGPGVAASTVASPLFGTLLSARLESCLVAAFRADGRRESLFPFSLWTSSGEEGRIWACALSPAQTFLYYMLTVCLLTISAKLLAEEMWSKGNCIVVCAFFSRFFLKLKPHEIS